jgi:hypothetical protein
VDRLEVADKNTQPRRIEEVDTLQVRDEVVGAVGDQVREPLP